LWAAVGICSGLLWADEPEQALRQALAERDVTLAYGDLERLISLAAERASEEKNTPPTESGGILTGLVHHEVQIGAEGEMTWRVSAEVRHDGPAPFWVALGQLPGPVARATVKGGRFGWDPSGQAGVLLDAAGTAEVELELALGTEGSVSWQVERAVAVQVQELADEWGLEVHDGTASREVRHAGWISLGPGLVRVQAVRRKDPTAMPSQTLGMMVLESASYRTEVAREGGVWTEGQWRLDPDGAETLAWVLPTGARLMRCLLADGRPLQVTEQPTESGLQCTADLPAKTDKGPVELLFAYLEESAALSEAEGEMTLRLPRTEILARDVIWQIDWPEGYEIKTSGLARPRESRDAAATGLLLGRKLCRDSDSAVVVSYRRPGN
ncbi:MAG: hypothetical protein KDK99_06880, partial [Verrucomicrobiales bacterium]|nr:hypothetical protein [Verrucomicrobiales bacterium]